LQNRPPNIQELQRNTSGNAGTVVARLLHDGEGKWRGGSVCGSGRRLAGKIGRVGFDFGD